MIRKISFTLHLPEDEEVWRVLEAQSNRSEFLRVALRFFVEFLKREAPREEGVLWYTTRVNGAMRFVPIRNPFASAPSESEPQPSPPERETETSAAPREKNENPPISEPESARGSETAQGLNEWDKAVEDECAASDRTGAPDVLSDVPREVVFQNATAKGREEDNAFATSLRRLVF